MSSRNGIQHVSQAVELGQSPLLPRITAVAAHALQRAYAWPEPFTLETAGGRYALRWDYAARLTAGVPLRYRFSLGPAAGWLLLEPVAERELIGDAADPAVPETIRCALMADALSTSFDALETRTRHEIVLRGPECEEEYKDGNEASQLRFSVVKHGSEWHTHGALHFDDPRFLGIACPSDPSPPALAEDDFNALPVPLAFCIGSTALSQIELSGLRCGDIIAIEQWKSSSAGITCAASTRGAGGWIITGCVAGALITIEQIQRTSASTSPEIGVGSAASEVFPVDLLEMNITFELEPRALPLAQIKTLQPHFVVELKQSLNQSVVHILANGRQIGHGHLIAVGNKLGIRVSKLLSTEGGKP